MACRCALERDGSSHHILNSLPDTPEDLTPPSLYDFEFDSCMHDLVTPDQLQLSPAESHHDCSHHDPGFTTNITFAPLYSYPLPTAQENPTTKASPFKSTQQRQSTNYCLFGSEPSGCLKIGLKTLTTLSTAAPSRICIFSKSFMLDPHKPRFVDAALSANRDAMDSVARILDCPSCLATPTAHMVVVSICDKLIAWNQAALLGAASTPEEEDMPSFGHHPLSSILYSGAEFSPISGSEGSTPLGGSSDGGYNSTTSATSTCETRRLDKSRRGGRQSATVRVGDFVLDDALADQAVRCVVLHDLDRIEVLVNRLAVGGSSSGGGSSDADHHQPFKRTVHQSLVVLLQRRLHAARSTMLANHSGTMWSAAALLGYEG
ncbi:hypothetical protein B0H63DRAFT_197661 [Podospora didyma]|uniref:Aflatoxin regulatory protein domain-containing protein n=1 Tax=Podospora didyma TaxID=330526 RepID=A0AAE0TVM1_9PEZI|nr:hypothetical protein B0H63DRAFT_197661 [Podospora didyma]